MGVYVISYIIIICIYTYQTKKIIGPCKRVLNGLLWISASAVEEFLRLLPTVVMINKSNALQHSRGSSLKISPKIVQHVVDNGILFRAGFFFLFFLLISSQRHSKTKRKITRESLSLLRESSEPKNYYCDVIIEAFNEDRFPVLGRIIHQYRACHWITSIYLRTNFSIEYTQQFLQGEVHPSKYQLLFTQSTSLNERFRIPTDSRSTCIVIADDDILANVDDLSLLHQVWLYNRRSLVGPFSRKISVSTNGNIDILYEDSSNQYNLILTKLLFVHKMYMKSYHSKKFRDIRAVVDEFHNCEDIAINIVASLLNGYPIHVDIQPLDLGDSRNDNADLFNLRRNGIGLRPYHWAKRHECFQHMFRLYRHLPRLQTVSIIKFAGEHSLCHQGGEEIPCRNVTKHN